MTTVDIENMNLEGILEQFDNYNFMSIASNDFLCHSSNSFLFIVFSKSLVYNELEIVF
jgi:hypothetical protein